MITRTTDFSYNCIKNVLLFTLIIIYMKNYCDSNIQDCTTLPRFKRQQMGKKTLTT